MRHRAIATFLILLLASSTLLPLTPPASGSSVAESGGSQPKIPENLVPPPPENETAPESSEVATPFSGVTLPNSNTACAGTELIHNGDFSRGLEEWVVTCRTSSYWERYGDERALPTITTGTFAGRSAVRFARYGYGGWYQCGQITQHLDVDVSGATSLVLSVDVYLHYQQLGAGGYWGGEYPAWIMVEYLDSGGCKQVFQRAFYYWRAYVVLEFAEQIPRGVWYRYSTDLVTLRPVRILSVSLRCNGWDAETYMTNVSLKVEIPAAPLETALGRPVHTVFTKEPVNTSIGNYVYQHQDLFIPAKGLPIALVRAYNSLDNYCGPLGAGWTHSYNVSLRLTAGRAVLMNEEGGREIYTLVNGAWVPPPGVHATLVQNPDGTFTLTRPTRVRLNFDPQGKLLSIVDRNQNRISLSYEGERLVGISDPVGRPVLRFQYDNLGRIVGVSDLAGRCVGYAYDEDGNLVEFTDVAGGRTRYVYENGRMARVIQPNGNVVVQNFYDEAGRVIRQIDGEGNETTFTYQPGKTVVRDAGGHETVYHYDGYYRTTKEVDPLGSTVSYEFDGAGNLTGIIDKAGRRIRLTYDGRGNLTGSVDRAGGAFNLTYDGDGNLIRFEDPVGSLFRLGYDKRGNLISLEDPLGNVTRLTYDEFGQLSSITDAQGNKTEFLFDNFGNLVKLIGPENNVRTYTYDPLGRLVSYTDPRGNITELSYTPDGRVRSLRNPLGGITRFEYDANGNLIRLTDPRGNATEYRYDNLNRLVEVIDALGNRTRYEYNYLWQPSAVETGGRRIRYEYNANGDLVGITDRLGRTRSFTYDEAGNVVARTDGLGRTIRYGYDNEERLVEVIYPDGSGITFVRDALGRITEVTYGENLTIRLRYDPLGRLLEFTDPSGRGISYAYDEVGMPVSVTYPDNRRVEYTHDGNYRVKSVRDWSGRETVYSYDAAGNPLEAILPNGIVVRYGWDGLNRLTRIAAGREGRVLCSYEYSHDANGNRTSQTRVVGGSREVTEYGYDPLNQLVEVREKGRRRVYTYDAFGNRRSLTEYIGGFGRMTAYEYDEANQLVRVMEPNRVVTCEYDNNGNLIGENESLRLGSKYAFARSTVYSYDFEDRLVRVETSRPGGLRKVVEYGYDGLGARVSRREYRMVFGKMVENEVEYYVNDITGPLEQVLQTFGEDGVKSTFLYGMNRVACFDRLGRPHYYPYDGLGSVIGMADGRGIPEAFYSYDEFGVPTPATEALLLAARIGDGLANTYAFTGEDYDASTDLLYLRARYYKPEVGRFITRDDFAGFPMLPISQNLYAYCHNSPATYVDPSGRIVFIPAVVFICCIVIGGTSSAAYHYFTAPPEQRSLEDYAWAFGKGALIATAAWGLGTLAAGLVSYVTSMPIATEISYGITSASVSQIGFNWSTGRPWNEDVITSTMLNTGFNMVLPTLPGFRYRVRPLGFRGPGGSSHPSEAITERTLTDIFTGPSPAESSRRLFPPCLKTSGRSSCVPRFP